MEWIQRLLESGTTPIVTAFLLGLLTAMARKSEFRQVQPVAEKHEQPDQNKCRSDDRIAVFADDFLQGVGVRPFAQQGNE